MHSHVNTCYLWCEVKNIFPLDRNTIWSCRLLDFGEMYHDFSSSKMFEILWKLWKWEIGRPALIINRTQCWLNNSDTRTPRKELEAKKWWFDMYNRIWKHNLLSRILNISRCKSILLSFVICMSNVIAHLRQSQRPKKTPMWPNF